MSNLQDFHELTDAAHRARELSEQLNYKINSCLDNLGEFLSDDLERPAIVEDYEPIL